jgi:hypothetical protein
MRKNTKYIHVFVDIQRIGLLCKVTRPNGASGLGIHVVLFVAVRFQLQDGNTGLGDL